MGYLRVCRVVAATVVLVGTGVHHASAAEDAIGIARGVVDVEVAAIAAKDAAGVANTYLPDGIFQSASGVYKGRAAVQAYREAGFKAGVYKEDVSVSEAVMVGDVIYDVGEFTVYLDTAEGPRQFKGRWGGALVRSGSDWKVALVTAVVSAAPPPAKP